MEILTAEVVSYIKPELLINVPVLNYIGMCLKASDKIWNNNIPFWLMGISIMLALFWVTGTTGTHNLSLVAFTSITQGILVASLAWGAHHVYRKIS